METQYRFKRFSGMTADIIDVGDGKFSIRLIRISTSIQGAPVKVFLGAIPVPSNDRHDVIRLSRDFDAEKEAELLAMLTTKWELPFGEERQLEEYITALRRGAFIEPIGPGAPTPSKASSE
jgi:hypothetical protein